MNRFTTDELRHRSVMSLSLLTVIILFLLAFPELNISANTFGSILSNLSSTSLFSQMFPPNIDRIIPIAQAVLTTLFMAFVGSLFAVIPSFALALISSKLFVPNILLRSTIRVLITIIRTIPSLVWALLLISVVGLGPRAGTLAIMVSTIGFCGRFFAEAIDTINIEPIESLRAIGARPVALLFCGILPQAFSQCINIFLFAFESAVRSSAVLGIVGAGGIGIELLVSMQTMRYDQAVTILLLIFIMVLTIEHVNAQIRRIVK